MTAACAHLSIYLLNALWQIPMIYVAAWAMERSLRPWGPAREHRVWVGALAAELLLPALSALPWPSLAALGRHLLGIRNGTSGQVSVSTGPLHVWHAVLSHQLLWRVVAALWALASIYFAARLAWQYRKARQLLRRSTPLALTAEAQELWRLCEDRFQLPEVTLAECAEIHGPITLGLRRRWILLPPGLLARLSRQEVLTIFSHECAHIARGDFAKHLVYRVVGLPLAFHPAAWLTQRRIVESREWICDARAAAQGGSSALYARSLLRLASLLVQPSPAWQSNTIGIFDANPLEERMIRLTQSAVQLNRTRRIAATAACALLTAGVALPAWAWSTHAADTEVQSEASTATPVHVASGIMAGQLETHIHPVYPPEAKSAGIQGAVVLDATIGADGNLSALKLVSGPPELAKAAWAAVSQWSWKPYLLNGQPTPVQTTITVTFHLAQ